MSLKFGMRVFVVFFRLLGGDVYCNENMGGTSTRNKNLVWAEENWSWYWSNGATGRSSGSPGILISPPRDVVAVLGSVIGCSHRDTANVVSGPPR